MTHDVIEEALISDELKRLGLGQRLVKSWRLKHPVKRGMEGTHRNLIVGLYIEPSCGLFYARVPEDDTGTLYADLTLPGLRNQVMEALTDLANNAVEIDERVWERRVRICYSGGLQKTGAPLTGEATVYDHINGNGYSARRRARQPPDAVSCIEVGALTFARYERAMQPGGRRWDEREWLEDYDARVAYWRSLAGSVTQEEHRQCRPKRNQGAQWVRGHIRDVDNNRKRRRDLPWSADLWAHLATFTQRFGTLHSALTQLLFEAEDDAFMASLAQGPRLLPGRGVE